MIDYDDPDEVIRRRIPYWRLSRTGARPGRASLTPPAEAIEAFIVAAWRRSPRPSLGQIAYEVRERFDRKTCHGGVRNVLAHVPAEDLIDPETTARPPFDDEVWIAAVQARVRLEAGRWFAARHDGSPAPRAGGGLKHDSNPVPPTPVHEILRRVPVGHDAQPSREMTDASH